LPVVVSKRAEQWVGRAGSDQQFAEALEIRVQVMPGYRNYGEITRRAKRRAAAGFIQLPDLLQLQSQEKPSSEHTKSSFVIDFDEPEVRQLSTSLKPADAQPSISTIEAFVSNYIEHKTYVRAFDIASRVARSKSGDCTEHAVLATALLRQAGYSARLVLGVVLVGIQQAHAASGIMAAGHAWVEVYREKRWHVVDAALRSDPKPGGAGNAGVVGVPGLPDAVSLKRAYLPLNVLRNEGPGYARSLMEEEGIEGVIRIFVDAKR
jgi:hypothetical protein